MPPLVVSSSPYTPDQIIEKLKKVLESKKITLFALIDHSQAARQAALDLPKEVLVIFGDPKAGTFLMQENPEIGIELPLKILVWQTDQGTKIGYKDPLALAEVYGIQKNIEILKKISVNLAELIKKIKGST